MNIEDKIKEFLDIHFDLLKTESGSSVTENVKQAALMQVLLYWRRLKHVAKNVTETEVKLSLPNQSTSQKRKYGIDAVVDIVQTDQETIMYDFSTLSPLDFEELVRDLLQASRNIQLEICELHLLFSLNWFRLSKSVLFFRHNL